MDTTLSNLRFYKKNRFIHFRKDFPLICLDMRRCNENDRNKHFLVLIFTLQAHLPFHPFPWRWWYLYSFPAKNYSLKFGTQHSFGFSKWPMLIIINLHFSIFNVLILVVCDDDWVFNYNYRTLFFHPFPAHFLWAICMLQQGAIFEKLIFTFTVFFMLLNCLLWILHFHVRPYAFARFFWRLKWKVSEPNI